jgi:hypothetical protein
MVGSATAGCASVPLATPQEDFRVKSLAPPADAGLVYLYRNESLGAAIRMSVLVDGVYAGDTAAQTYMVWQLRPGAHFLISKTENDSRLDFFVEPGRRYYVWQEVKMGLLSARSDLKLVPDNVGQGALAGCKLVQMPLATGH